MTNDELRALADCLDDPNAMQRTARRKAADYLRAQADAQPVAWLDPVSQYSASQWLIDNMNPEQRADFSVPLYAAPAPAAQREPTPGERLREAGFTRRDNRIECGECGKLFTPQFLQIHKCGGGDE